MELTERELEADAQNEKDWADLQRAKDHAEHTRKWLEEEEMTGRLELLFDEANWRIAESERAASIAISRAMANV